MGRLLRQGVRKKMGEAVCAKRLFLVRRIYEETNLWELFVEISF